MNTIDKTPTPGQPPPRTLDDLPPRRLRNAIRFMRIVRSAGGSFRYPTQRHPAWYDGALRDLAALGLLTADVGDFVAVRLLREARPPANAGSLVWLFRPVERRPLSFDDLPAGRLARALILLRTVNAFPNSVVRFDQRVTPEWFDRALLDLQRLRLVAADDVYLHDTWHTTVTALRHAVRQDGGAS